jgi:hypothetical protein
MAEPGRTSAVNTSAVRIGAARIGGAGDAVNGSASNGSASNGSTAEANTSEANTSDANTADANTADGSITADGVTVVLRGADTARARMPTPAERDSLGLGQDVPVWVITRAGGGTELYPADSTVIVPAG